MKWIILLIIMVGIVPFTLGFADDFNRANNDDVGNDWEEIEDLPSRVSITSNYLSVNDRTTSLAVTAKRPINDGVPYEITNFKFSYWIEGDGYINQWRLYGADENGTLVSVVNMKSNSGRFEVTTDGSGWINQCPSLRFTWYDIEFKDFNWVNKTYDLWCAGSQIRDDYKFSDTTAVGATNYSVYQARVYVGEIRIDDYDDSVPVCAPNWTCSGYGSCLINDTQECNAAVDNNSCGVSYTGDYSEFPPLVCDYCTPDWVCSGYTVCNSSGLQSCDTVTDNNVCGESYTGDYSEFSDQSCTYSSGGSGSKRSSSTSRTAEVEESEPEEKTGWDGFSDGQKLVVIALGGIVAYSIFTAKPKPRRIRRRK